MRDSNGRRQSPEREGSLYDRDFALWIETQAAALRAGDVGALDLENLVEELEGLTKRDERALGSRLKRIMAHMLKQRCQPERDAELGRVDQERSRADRRYPRPKPESAPFVA
jgi:hypothetical protein